MTATEVNTCDHPDLLAPVTEFLGREHGLLVDNELTAGEGEHIEVIDPSTGRRAAGFREATTGQVHAAIASARKAFDGPWSTSAPRSRERAVYAVAEIVESHRDELAQLEVIDTGKPLRNAVAEVTLAANVFRYYAGWPTKVSGSVNPTSKGLLSYSTREPIGVCAQITAWNYPFLLASWKIAPAIALGNTVVVKPPELAPLSTLRLGELCVAAGLPPGVVNVVPGTGALTGQALIEGAVDKIAFTGSTAVGKHVAAVAATSMKRVTLELGGKSPNIVFADADLDHAVAGAVRGIFWNSGQVCVAGSRLLVQKSIADDFLNALIDAASKLRVGSGFDPKSDLGALISREHKDRVLGHAQRAREDGAQQLLGDELQSGEGFFVPPTVFGDVTPDMRIARDEVFGPVLAVMTFEDEEEAVRLANATQFGLAAAIWTRDIGRAHRVAASVKAGTVWLNTFGAMEPTASFGGFKESGVGRELGEHAISAYTEVKSVYVNLD